MPTTLLSGPVWPRVTKLSKTSNVPAIAAVPYFGTGANDLIKFRNGSVLIVKFDKESVSSGQVDPREIIKAMNLGTEVHHCSNIHAKVFIFGKTAVVGSSNISRNSENYLLEACIETTNRKVISDSERFINSLRGDIVGTEYAKEMVKHYNPPKFIGKKPRSVKKSNRQAHAGIWFLQLTEVDWDDIDDEHEAKGRGIAEQTIKDTTRFQIDYFMWHGDKSLSRFKIGARVIMCLKKSNDSIYVSPPSRIINIERYIRKGKTRAIVHLETPTKYRMRSLDSFINRLNEHADKLGNPRRTKFIKNPELLKKIARYWP